MNLGSGSGIQKSLYSAPKESKTRTSINNIHLVQCLQHWKGCKIQVTVPKNMSPDDEKI